MQIVFKHQLGDEIEYTVKDQIIKGRITSMSINLVKGKVKSVLSIGAYNNIDEDCVKPTNLENLYDNLVVFKFDLGDIVYYLQESNYRIGMCPNYHHFKVFQGKITGMTIALVDGKEVKTVRIGGYEGIPEEWLANTEEKCEELMETAKHKTPWWK